MSRRAERRLLKLLKQRNEAAFEELVRLHGQQVFSIAFRMLGNHAEAEDMAQEIFITVFKRIDSFRGDSSLSTWLYRVTVNHCKNRIKYLARRKDQQKREYDETRGRASDPGRAVGGQVDRPDEIVEAMEMESVIQDVLGTLDEDHRTILVLREMECMSYNEIADIMKLEVGTVKSKLHRARASFMKGMKKAYGDRRTTPSERGGEG